MDDGYAAKWQERMGRWSKSGLPMAEFARREGVTTGQFGYWKKRLGVRPALAGAAQRSNAMVPVIVTNGLTPPTADDESCRRGEVVRAMEVVVAEGVIVRVAPGFDEMMLARVVRALRRIAGAEATS